MPYSLLQTMFTRTCLISCVLFLAAVSAQEKKNVNCWRGSQCDSCNSTQTASTGTETVCCPTCYSATRIRITLLDSGDTCTCFMVPPPAGSAHFTSMSGTMLLATMTLLWSLKQVLN